LLVRICLLALGSLGIFWGATELPRFWRDAHLIQISKRIEGGELYKGEVIAALMPEVEAAERSGANCRPQADHAAAVIRLRILEDAIADEDNQTIDRSMAEAGRAIHLALACSPADPFLWSALYRLEVTRSGFTGSDLALLRLSYLLGPNEGWIALKRNPLALSVYRQLPADLQKAALDEFAGLLRTGRLYQETVAIFTGAGWPVRDLLLARIADLPERDRDTFSRILYREGYDVAVPGIKRSDPRPWD